MVNDIVANYGHVIVDECHHVSAFTFEQVMKEVKARFVLGLTATPLRRDGHHPIIFMQCGPIRHRGSNAPATAHVRHVVIVRHTQLAVPQGADRIQSLFGSLVQSESRNSLIVEDILTSLADGRTPLVLTERKDHLDRRRTLSRRRRQRR